MKIKIISIAIILLFIGVVVAPSINFTVVKASTDNDLIEVTSEACGIKGYGNTTVQLTKQQYQEFQDYLVEFRARLNTTTTREEAVPIFNEAVAELNKYGLLPKGMNVEQTQMLTTKDFQNKKITKLMSKIYDKQPLLSNNSNFLCLIAGDTTKSTIIGLLPISIPAIAYIEYMLMVLFNEGKIKMPLLGSIFGIISLVTFMFALISYFFPMTLFSVMTMGLERYSPFPSPPSHSYYPSIGWVDSFGLKGAKKWNGSFYGNIFLLNILLFTLIGIGVIGFTGIKIALLDHCFYLGSALWVKIGPNLL